MDGGSTAAFFVCILVPYLLFWWYVKYKILTVNQSQGTYPSKIGIP